MFFLFSCKEKCNELPNVQGEFFDVLIDASIRDTLKSDKRWKHMKCVLLDESIVEYHQCNMGAPTYYECFRRESYGLNISRENVNLYKNKDNMIVGYFVYFNYIKSIQEEYYNKVVDGLYFAKDGNVQVLDLSDYYHFPNSIWKRLLLEHDLKREVLAKGNYDYVLEINNMLEFDKIIDKFKKGAIREQSSLTFNSDFRYFYDDEYDQILKVPKNDAGNIELILPAKAACFECR